MQESGLGAASIQGSGLLEIGQVTLEGTSQQQVGNASGSLWTPMVGDAHRAMADVEALFTVMDRLCRQFPENLGTLGGLLRTGEVQPTIVQSVEQVALSGTAQLLNRNRGTPIQIQYESKASGLSRRTVTPIEIFVDNGMEFLGAYRHRRLENRTFRVSRITVIH